MFQDLTIASTERAAGCAIRAAGFWKSNYATMCIWPTKTSELAVVPRVKLINAFRDNAFQITSISSRDLTCTPYNEDILKLIYACPTTLEREHCCPGSTFHAWHNVSVETVTLLWLLLTDVVAMSCRDLIKPSAVRVVDLFA
ncbi:hypothetical protein CBL_13474 [Carabus blaptoides fortunei]